MSKLQKKISTIGRREGPGIGFAAGRRAQSRAMLLGLLAQTYGMHAIYIAAGVACAVALAVSVVTGREMSRMQTQAT